MFKAGDLVKATSDYKFFNGAIGLVLEKEYKQKYGYQPYDNVYLILWTLCNNNTEYSVYAEFEIKNAEKFKIIKVE
jgi:hypothetical protein